MRCHGVFANLPPQPAAPSDDDGLWLNALGGRRTIETVRWSYRAGRRLTNLQAVRRSRCSDHAAVISLLLELAVWRGGSVVRRTNEVTLRRDG